LELQNVRVCFVWINSSPNMYSLAYSSSEEHISWVRSEPRDGVDETSWRGATDRTIFF